MPRLRFHCEVCGLDFGSCDSAAKCERGHEVKAFEQVVAVIGSNTRPRKHVSVHLMRKGEPQTLCGMLTSETCTKVEYAAKVSLCPACDKCRLAKPPI